MEFPKVSLYSHSFTLKCLRCHSLQLPCKINDYVHESIIKVTDLRYSRIENMTFSDVFIQSWVLFSLIFIFENFFLLILFWVLLNSLLSFCFTDWFFFISTSLFSFILVYFEKKFFHYCSVAKPCLTHGLTVACQAPLSSTVFWSLLKFMFI